MPGPIEIPHFGHLSADDAAHLHTEGEPTDAELRMMEYWGTHLEGVHVPDPTAEPEPTARIFPFRLDSL